MPTDHTLHRGPASLGFLAAAAAALGVGELAAGAVESWRSPVQAVAETFIDRAPEPVTKFGIETFGTNDKAALVIGILVTIALVAPLVGRFAATRRLIAPVGFGVFGAVGLFASADGASLLHGIPSVVAALAGFGIWQVLVRLSAAESTASDASVLDRRRFLLGATSFVAVGAVAASAGRALRRRFSAVASRAAVMLPGAKDPLPPAPASASFDVDGLASLYTPNRDFYRIDTALTVPQVPAEDWTLRLHGMVDEPYEIDFDELLSMGLVERDITLTCVSNEVGGELVGNARWLGVPLRDVLDRAGVADDADQIVGRAVDGYTCGFPVEAAYDREAIVAVGMNGEPLPLSHGFPARLVTPGLYGYVSATKWLTEIELTRFDTFEQYWVPRGYSEMAPIKTMSRIDVPSTGETLEPGETTLAGVAWSQPQGISKVEVKIDDQAFAEAELAEALNENTWRQWRFPWTATEGNHRITVRATDGDGNVQTEERAPIRPDGATGWQELLVVVRGSSS
ncbi:MAG: molybdopterin-dependent oxidoreductase [Acidimicrobiales bacterium]|nr:molybdopterin-dependent oxidoreductase [Acidimicrobiales bacterium]